MEVISRLKTHYEQYPPRLSYGGNEGKNITGKRYQKWPTEEEFNSLGIAAVKVWHEKLPATADTFPVEGYCVVDTCLDNSGRLIPDALPLWPEMEGHELSICVYVDRLDRIHMRAIGGFTSFETRSA
jgi:hypothetical protein